MQLDNANKTIEGLESRIKELERLLQASEQANKDKAKELDGMRSTVTKLQKEGVDKDNQLAELMRRMEAEKDEVKKVVEKAIVSSVRLCVVAPTVNVHIPEKKLKFQVIIIIIIIIINIIIIIIIIILHFSQLYPKAS